MFEGKEEMKSRKCRWRFSVTDSYALTHMTHIANSHTVQAPDARQYHHNKLSQGQQAKKGEIA